MWVSIVKRINWKEKSLLMESVIIPIFQEKFSVEIDFNPFTLSLFHI